MNEQEFTELAAGHALHALSDADERRFRAVLAAHPEWRHLVQTDVETAAALADAVPAVAPPPALRAELLTRIATTPQQADGDDPRPSADEPTGAEAARPRRSRWMFVLAACLVLLVGGGIATATIVSQLQRPAAVVALEQIRSASDAEQGTAKLASGATATAHWSAELGRAVLVTTDLIEASAGETYELWLVRDGTPLSAGLFDTEAGGATALLDLPLHEGDAIAVTVEPAGGSPTGAPTSDPIIVIPTA